MKRMCGVVACAAALFVGQSVGQPLEIPEGVDYRVKKVAPGDSGWDVLKDNFGFGAPEFRSSDPDNFPSRRDQLAISNLADSSREKNLYLLITFNDDWDGRTVPNLTVGIDNPLPNQQIVLVRDAMSPGEKIAFYHWRLDPQPGDEFIQWSGDYLYDFTNSAGVQDISQIELATWCVPTPGGFLLIGLAALPLACRRHR